MSGGIEQELVDVLLDRRGGGIGELRLQVGHQAGHVALAVELIQDGTGAVVELHHAFGIEQHVAALGLFPLQAPAGAQTINGGGVDRGHHSPLW